MQSQTHPRLKVRSILRWGCFVLCALGLVLGHTVSAVALDRDTTLALARKGWTYDHPRFQIEHSDRVRIDGRQMSGAALCLIGEQPHQLTEGVIDVFRTLMAEIFGKPLPMRFAGADASACGSGRVVILRLYSDAPPHDELTKDLRWLNATYGLGLRLRNGRFAPSPAFAQTFFGTRGQGTHIMVMQPARPDVGPLEADFFSSLLVEELFHTFTFGQDIPIRRRGTDFSSKLQEFPVNVGRLPWTSRRFMRALLKSNPRRLCAFDVFMLHGIARAPGSETAGPDFLAFLDSQFDALSDLAGETMRDPRFGPVVDSSCARSPHAG